ncbi:MAG TPA: ATP-binding cassette domain-containing protein [Terriglobales bacterium]|nr:ATP-binding cassette domain-containing protein [Terriglobales bacterium]
MSGALSVNIRRTYPAAKAPAFVLDVKLEFEPGISAIFGPSGSGKSTLLECVAGLQRPDEGRITFRDECFFDSLAGVESLPRSREIGYLFQSPALFPHMTVQQNVEYGLQGLPAAERSSRTKGALERFHIAEIGGRRPGAISGGEQQRAALARAIVTNPKLLFLDEPFSALDYTTKAKIMDDLRQWQKDNPVPVLFVSHAIEEVLALASRVVVLHKGTTEEDGRPSEVLAGQRERLLRDLALSDR